MSCGGQLAREAWARLGCHAALPLEMALHAETCDGCARFIADVRRSRQLGASLEAHQLAPTTLHEIQRRLRTETRQSPALGFVTRGNQRRWQWLAVVAVGLLVGTVGVAAVQVGKLIRARLDPLGTTATGLPAGLAKSSDAAPQTADEAPNPPSTPSAASPEIQHAAPGASNPSRPAAGDSTPDDSAFAEAFRLLGAGDPTQAAAAFEGLLKRSRLDPSRRADVLYWASQAHARANHAALAEARARLYVEAYPSSLHYGDAALLVGDLARNRGATSLARDYYERALRAARAATRARARDALASLGR